MATTLTASPSPSITPSTRQSDSISSLLSPNSRRENKNRIGNSKTASPIVKPHPAHVSAHSLTSPSPTFVSAQAQPSPSQAVYTSSNPASRSQCTSPPEARSHLPSVRSISTQTTLSPTRTTFRPSNSNSRPEVVMVDAQTQYSPPPQTDYDSSTVQHRLQANLSGSLTQTPTSNLAHLHLTTSGSLDPPQASTSALSSTDPVSRRPSCDPVADAAMPAAPLGLVTSDDVVEKEQMQQHVDVEEKFPRRSQSSSKRDHSTTVSDPRSSPRSTRENGDQYDAEFSAAPADMLTTPSKKPRPPDPDVKIMPLQYELCDTRDLVILISSMLMELIRYNDTIPLSSGSEQSSSTSNLTRFHSRAPPGISVVDYLQRLTTYATLSPPILLSMVYYIDRLASFYPAFTISSLTVHRFLITAATVASKGLSDSFWTNKTYAKVGGVSVKELALLELEFLVRVQWRIVPRPETLVDYYKSLVGRSIGYCVEGEDDNSADEGQDDGNTQD